MVDKSTLPWKEGTALFDHGDVSLQFRAGLTGGGSSVDAGGEGPKEGDRKTPKEDLLELVGMEWRGAAWDVLECGFDTASLLRMFGQRAALPSKL